MIQKQSFNVIKGMRQDISPSKANPEYIFDARNIRLTARGNDTLLSISNEQGTSECSPTDGYLIQGIVLGYCVLNKFLVVFSRSYLRYDKTTEYITRVYYQNNEWKSDILYTTKNRGLNFGDTIQTLGIYENENIQKVYWVDGVNQPRVINITKDYLENKTVEEISKSYTDTSFDFIPTLALNEIVNVHPIESSSGQFQAGVIQYAMTYYNKYGQESNIFYTTDLYNITNKDRGGNVNENISTAFQITINGLDSKFNKIRLYSIYRSSINSTPYVKKITDLSYSYRVESAIFSDTPYYFIGFDNTPSIIIEGTITIIDGNFDKTYLPSSTTNASGDFYVFYYSDYKQYFTDTTSKFYILLDYQKYTFPENATDDTYIAVSVNSGSFGPVTGRRMAFISNEQHINGLKFRKLDKDEVKIDSITYIDNNTTGESIDPTLLLYVGGEEIIANTISQKDNTLFLGDITLKKPSIPQEIKNSIRDTDSTTIKEDYRQINIKSSSIDNVDINTTYYDNVTTFKQGEHYRLGLQFQYKTGQWSEPIVLNSDYTVEAGASYEYKNNQFEYKLPILKKTLSSEFVKQLINLGYKRVRGVIVNPSSSDRKIITQGILCPTLKYGDETKVPSDNTELKVFTYWYSWFMRAIPLTQGYEEKEDSSSIWLGTTPAYIHDKQINSATSRRGEIDGYMDSITVRNCIRVNQNLVTLHSPDIQFDESLQNLNLQSEDIQLVIKGCTKFIKNYGDINIQTSSPAIAYSGFIHHRIKNDDWPLYSSANLMTGGFYLDDFVDYKNDIYQAHSNARDGSPNYMIYPWQCSGSINNDCIRPANKGTRSAVLKRKVISNYKYSAQTIPLTKAITFGDINVQVFNSDQVQLLKIRDKQYLGNVDTLLSDSTEISKLASGTYDTTNKKFQRGDHQALNIQKLYNVLWGNQGIYGEDETRRNLVFSDFNVRIKYKSSPHLLIDLGNYILPKTNINAKHIINVYEGTKKTQGEVAITTTNTEGSILYLGELRRTKVFNAFGGDNEVAFKNNNWIPSGISVSLKEGEQDITVEFLHGDCYYQRYDCLRTYSFTNEDENSIIDIASFMTESRVCLEGRYDRNKSLISHLNVSPQNFNLFNPAYTQKDNFFNYRILDEDYYKLNTFPNNIIWSKEKFPNDEIDQWTNINMNSTFDVDGNLGQIQSIENYNNELYCFQDKGISRILFNNRVQIPTGDNVPIEISNGYKVQGKVYISNTVGCQNQRAIKVTPNGIYFSDLYNSGIYLLNQQGMQDISTPRGFTNWVKECQPDRLHYDANNGDLYLIGNGYISNTYRNCLCFSEKINEFTSFMDYNYANFMFNIDNSFYSLYDKNIGAGSLSILYKMFDGDYNNFFGETKPYHISYIANQNPINDKIFNTIEFRADTLKPDDKLVVSDINSKSPNICPFNKVTVWNEYQEGTAELSKILGKPSNLKEKFRTWRVNIPRDKSNNRDRIRNPWAYIKLEGDSNNYRMQLHDLQVWYYDNSIYGYNQRQQ